MRPMESSSVRRGEILSASPRMFENPVLDSLSRVHPAVPPVIFVPAIVISFVLGVERIGVGRTLLAVVLGYIVWTLTEYWLHRLVFHFEPEDGLGARLHWIIHGVHHDHPNDPMRLVMPPSVSVPLAAGFLGLFVLAAGVALGRRAVLRLHRGLSGLRHAPLPHASPPAEDARWASACASCTCAITSRTTGPVTASARPTGTTCSAPRRVCAPARSRRVAARTTAFAAFAQRRT